VKGRFAPTPSGDLHLGGARTALAAWLHTRAAGGALAMRVEDLDAPRAVPGAEARILEDLRWLGLDWDGETVRQSERLALFGEAVERLLAAGHAFPCFCSRKDVERAAQAPHGPSDDGPRYPGTCRALSGAEVAERSRTRAPSIRLRVEPGTIAWTDGLLGARADSVHDTVGDFVLRRSDGIYAYQLAVVVDDAAMGITDVVRGDDLASSTARQLLLYRALGLAAPRFLHVPLVLGPDGTRLAKRHGPISVRALRERGLTAPRLVGRLAATLGLAADGESCMPRDLIARFRVEALSRAPVVLDPAALQD
jgi:glutamyl-tRNA synthetase